MPLANLPTFPTEIILEIAIHLDVHSIHNFRLANRAFHDTIEQYGNAVSGAYRYHLDAVKAFGDLAPASGFRRVAFLSKKHQIVQDIVDHLVATRNHAPYGLAAKHIPDPDQLASSLYLLWFVLLRFHMQIRVTTPRIKPNILTMQSRALSTLPDSLLHVVASAAGVVERAVTARLWPHRMEILRRSHLPTRLQAFDRYIKYVISTGMETIHGILMAEESELLECPWLGLGGVNREGGRQGRSLRHAVKIVQISRESSGPLAEEAVKATLDA